MIRRELRPFIAFFALSAAIYFLRDQQESLVGYIFSSCIVLVFWYLNGLSITLSNLRNILSVALVFGVFIIGARLVFPKADDTVTMGRMFSGDLDPGSIRELKGSHEIALELYFDHKPSLSERYYKVGSLRFTQDGLHYSNKKSNLNPQNLPRTAAWVEENLTSGRLEEDQDKIKIWFAKEFSYSLSPGKLQSKQPLDEFLFDSRKGFCEHYAASLATLLKLRGYNARVVTGYAGGRWNPLFKKLTFEEADAHAWVEVQTPSTWQIVDPTEWVSPGVVESQNTDSSLWILVFVFAVGIGVFAFFFPKKADGVGVFLKKLEALENKRGMRSAGLTISERVARLIQFYPDYAEGMQSSLTLYTALFYAKEPLPGDDEKLRHSLSGWA